MNRLYLVHDEDYNYQIVVSANSATSAIEKLQNFIKETKQNINRLIDTETKVVIARDVDGGKMNEMGEGD